MDLPYLSRLLLIDCAMSSWCNCRFCTLILAMLSSRNLMKLSQVVLPASFSACQPFRAQSVAAFHWSPFSNIFIDLSQMCFDLIQLIQFTVHLGHRIINLLKNCFSLIINFNLLCTWLYRSAWNRIIRCCCRTLSFVRHAMIPDTWYSHLSLKRFTVSILLVCKILPCT